MTDNSTTDALDLAKEHAVKAWRMFIDGSNLTATLPDWRTSTTPDGLPYLSVEVVGPGAANALRRFVRHYHLVLGHDGDQRPQFDISQPGRTALVWRHRGVWVELWHPERAADAPKPAPVVKRKPAGPRTLRSFLQPRPGGPLPFTRRQRTDKEATTS